MVKPSILILDDNPTHQRLLGLMARRLGIEYQGVSVCSEAIAALETRSGFAAVFIDLNIPHNPQAMRCLQAIKVWRRRKALKMPIIAVTAYAMESERQECMRAGVDDYLSKPFTFSQFADVMRRSISWLPEEHRRLAS
jgi:CheY-like chemotaxis protein